MSETIDAVRKYEIRGEVSPLLTAVLSATVANDQTVLAAVAGKRIRVMGWVIQSTGAAVSDVSLKSGSGGTVLGRVQAPPNTIGNDKLPVTDSGYFETATGVGLFADVATTAAYINVHYLVYTP